MERELIKQFFLCERVKSKDLAVIRTDRECVRYHVITGKVTVMYRTKKGLENGLGIAALIFDNLH